MTSGDRRIDITVRDVSIRRSPHLAIYFRRRRLICENYFTRHSFQANQSTLRLLEYFDSWKTASQATRAFGDFSRKSILDSIDNLLRHGLLITKGSEQDRIDRRFGQEWLWPIPSRYYHFSTKIGETLDAPEQIRKYYQRYLKGKRQPPIYKTYPGRPTMKLPTWHGREAPLFHSLEKRRSTREFSGLPISLQQLSRILHYTWGRVSTYNTREFGRLLHKSSPSAGARHPIEAYAVVNNVDGLDRGIYHYSVKDHSLELLRQGDFREKCVSFAAGQQWTCMSSVLFIMTAVVARTAWKYRTPRVYRALLLDAGHLSQSFLLTSTALGLGAFCIGVISDLAIEKELGIDGISETALFVVGVGQAVKARSKDKPRSIL